MKHSIIKDFRSWNVIFEALDPLKPGEFDVVDAQGNVTKVLDATGKTIKEVNPPERRLTADQQTQLMSDKSVVSPESIKLQDGALTQTDIQNIQRVLLLGEFLMKGQTKDPAKPGDDGKVGPLTIQAIKDFRAKVGISDETVEPTATTIGPKTLAEINKRIAAGGVQMLPAAYATDAQTQPLANNLFDGTLTTEDDAQATAVSQAIKDLFTATTPAIKAPSSWTGGAGGSMVNSASLFAKYKTTINDDEDTAVKEVVIPWWNETVVPMLKKMRPGNPNIAIFDLEVAKQMSTEWNKYIPTSQMPTDGKFQQGGYNPPAQTVNTSAFRPVNLGYDSYVDMKDCIVKKTQGATASDTASWFVILTTGQSPAYQVDTDF